MLNRFCLFPLQQMAGAVSGGFVGFVAGLGYLRTLENDPGSVVGGSLVTILAILNGAVIGHAAAKALGLGSLLMHQTAPQNTNTTANDLDNLEAGNPSPRSTV